MDIPAFPQPSSRPDGGLAFPSHEASSTDPRNQISGGGMTIRDWFAGQAMAGMSDWTIANGSISAEDIAVRCYALADAAISARDAKAGA